MIHNRFNLLLFLTLFILCTAEGVRCETIYSWSGEFVAVGVTDPWGLDFATVPFALMVQVDGGASDLFDFSQELAAFEVSSATLEVDGLQWSIQGRGVIDFTDSPAGSLDPYDAIVFSGAFDIGGNLASFESSVALPNTTFEFEGPIGLPPAFGSAVVATNSGATGDDYASTVFAGAIVQAVPSPSTFSLGVAAGLLLFCRVSSKQKSM